MESTTTVKVKVRFAVGRCPFTFLPQSNSTVMDLRQVQQVTGQKPGQDGFCLVTNQRSLTFSPHGKRALTKVQAMAALCQKKLVTVGIQEISEGEDHTLLKIALNPRTQTLRKRSGGRSLRKMNFEDVD